MRQFGSDFTKCNLYSIILLISIPIIMSSLQPVTLSPPEISQLGISKPEQECDHCQRCLYMTFVWYQRAESRRMLKHKLKHICKRYFEYRRHCLMTLLPKIDIIADRMAAANRNGHYKPIRTCIILKECNKNQASLDADEMRALRSLAINDTLVARVEDLLTTTTQFPVDLFNVTQSSDILTEGKT